MAFASFFRGRNIGRQELAQTPPPPNRFYINDMSGLSEVTLQNDGIPRAGNATMAGADITYTLTPEMIEAFTSASTTGDFFSLFSEANNGNTKPCRRILMRE